MGLFGVCGIIPPSPPEVKKPLQRGFFHFRDENHRVRGDIRSVRGCRRRPGIAAASIVARMLPGCFSRRSVARSSIPSPSRWEGGERPRSILGGKGRGFTAIQPFRRGIHRQLYAAIARGIFDGQTFSLQLRCRAMRRDVRSIPPGWSARRRSSTSIPASAPARRRRWRMRECAGSIRA